MSGNTANLWLLHYFLELIQNFFTRIVFSYKPQTIIDDNITFFQAGFQ